MGEKRTQLIRVKSELMHINEDIADMKHVMKHALLTFHFKEYHDCRSILKRLKICRDKKRQEIQQLMQG